MSIRHDVPGADGVNLAVREFGKADGPAILFIHGFSQSHQSWTAQTAGALADEFRLIAMDIRGHGDSDKPAAPEHYTDGALWADDVAAVIDRLGLERPVLVGWSYGGFIMSDYIRAHGTGAIAGINYVGAAVRLTPAFEMIGPGFLQNAEAMLAPDLPTNIAGIRNFLRDCTAQPMDAETFEISLAFNMAVPSYVRVGLASRELNFDDVLAALDVPVLVTHGNADVVVLPSMGQHIVETAPNATGSFYDDVGHAPFLEAPDRFNRELAEFVRSANSG